MRNPKMAYTIAPTASDLHSDESVFLSGLSNRTGPLLTLPDFVELLSTDAIHLRSYDY